LLTDALPPDTDRRPTVGIGRWAGSGICRVNRSSHEADLRL